jgi:hypothetical protein
MASVTDIWFHSTSTLLQAAEALGLSAPDHDSENYWEWVNGELCGITLSITRAHAQSRRDAFVRVFRVDNGEFASDLTDLVIERLRPLALGSIKCGRWIYRSGNDFDLVVIEERP